MEKLMRPGLVHNKEILQVAFKRETCLLLKKKDKTEFEVEKWFGLKERKPFIHTHTKIS